jgi:regulator of CtrA degradation
MTDQRFTGPRPIVKDATSSEAETDLMRRLKDFTASELFERTFKEGMGMVEETAAYLDGPGRAASKRLSRTAALAYAGESMRLTTRLMQVASWLLVQRALREGEMSLAEAREDKYRLAGREPAATPFLGVEELPNELSELMRRAASLYERVRRLDETMYATAMQPERNAVGAHLARLKAAFGRDEG